MTFLEKRSAWLESLFLILIAALIYLPNVSRFTFHRDDWYYMYDGLVRGAGVFMAMFENLRPLRGPLYADLFALFGTNPLPYHLLLFVWRVLGGVGMGWLIRLLWPRQPRVPFWGAVLFVVYPGFLWWVAGFEYQPMVLSVAAQVFSFAFTLKSVTSPSPFARTVWVGAAILTSWLTLGLVEYAIGMEAFRYLCVYLVVNRDVAKPAWRGAWTALRLTAPSFLGPILFLVWRQFFFENIRKAADVGLQMGRLFDSPLTLLTWVARLFQGAADVLALAWTVPFREQYFGGDVKEMLVGLAFTAVAAALFVWFAARRGEQTEGGERWKAEAMTIGLLGAVAGLAPIIVANRYISFDRFSHYTLPVSIAAILFVVGLSGFITEWRVRAFVMGALVLFAGLTHSAMSARAAQEAEVINQFWWQMSWRAPGIKAGTTLVVTYPGVVYAEGSDIVWGPANFIYYPQAQSQLPIVVPLPAARMEADLLTNIQTGEELKQVYIVVNYFHYRFDNVLVVTQPAGSCVHVMDSRWLAIAPTEGGTLAEIAKYSKVENILASGEPVLQEQVFGREPAREWCYYFLRADLARQNGDWELVSALGTEASQKGYAASDPLEWIPFLQAGVFLGDADALTNLADGLKGNVAYKADRAYYKVQFCDALRALNAAGYPPPEETATLAGNLFCR
jgi:hypothetical protein